MQGGHGLKTNWGRTRDKGIAARWLALLCLAGLWFVAMTGPMPAPAQALEAIAIGAAGDRVELSRQSESYEGRGSQLQLDTAPGADGIAGRMSVQAQTGGTNPNWVVFALRNATDRQVERWLVAERYTLIGSGVLAPDLDAARLVHVTPSLGFVPERIPNDRADAFRITLDPGQTVTFVAELASVSGDRFPQFQLWKPAVYEKRLRDRTLFNGIMLGFTGLLAVFMTAIFGANHKLIFPSMALVAWSVLAYLCVDFGFWHKIFQLPAEDNGLYRATAEAAMAGSFVLFLYAFLRIGQWHTWLRLLFVVWIAAQMLLVAGAVIDPRFAATLARLSFVVTGGIGALFILYLALRGQDRAVALAPSWLLFLVWVFASGLAVSGRLTGDAVVLGLISGLVAILGLMSYSVTQFAFRSFEPLHALPQNALQTRSLAIDAASSAVWEWNARKDEIHVSGLLEDVLGLTSGEASGRVDEWMKHVHAVDRERLRLSLLSIQERNGGILQTQFRMRRSDGTYRWFELKASSVPQAEQRSLMCVGLLRDITHVKRSHERLVHNAVIDSLTGLPNRELFLDRVGMALRRAEDETERRLTPTVLFIGLDRFKSVNSTFGLIVGDSMLLTAAKRLSRHIAVQDSLGRIGGDQFAILLAADVDPQDVALLAERVRRSLRSPMKIAGKDIVLTGSIGIAAYDATQKTPGELLHEAELAMYRAKRAGPDRIEIFKPSSRGEANDQALSEADLKRAIERKQFLVLYQPVLRLANEELAGFEAVIRLEHPKLGIITPEDFLPVAEAAGLGQQLALHLAGRVIKDLAQWHKISQRADEPLFATVSLARQSLLSPDFVQEIKALLNREHLARNTLRLRIDEAALIENAERTVEMVDWLKTAGAGVTIERFGTGFSSLGHLARLQADSYQLDHSLLHEAIADPQAASLVRAVVALARELARTVTAEGIETPEDVAFLRAIGCQFGQGAYIGDPIADRDVLEVLETIRQSDRRGERRGLFGARRSSSAGEAISTAVATADVPRTKRPRPEPAASVPVAAGGGEALPDMRANDPVGRTSGGRARRSDAPEVMPMDTEWQSEYRSSHDPNRAAPASTSRQNRPSPAVDPRGGGTVTRDRLDDAVLDAGVPRSQIRRALPDDQMPPLAAAPTNNGTPRTRAVRAPVPTSEPAPATERETDIAAGTAAPVAMPVRSRVIRPVITPRLEPVPVSPLPAPVDAVPLTTNGRSSEGLARLSRGRLAEPGNATTSPTALYAPVSTPSDATITDAALFKPTTTAHGPAPVTSARPSPPLAALNLPPLSQAFEPPAPTAEELLASIASMNARVRGE